MKKIYIVSVDDDVPLSVVELNKIKLTCDYLYDEIIGLGYDKFKHILCTDGVVPNRLLENVNDGSFRFQYNDITSGKYDPFMIDDTSFGFTVNDGVVTDEEVEELLRSASFSAGFRRKFNISSVTYEDDHDRHNKNRLHALKKVLLDREHQKRKKAKYTRVKINPLLRPSAVRR